jgi:hypothetical protein
VVIGGPTTFNIPNAGIITTAIAGQTFPLTTLNVTSVSGFSSGTAHVWTDQGIQAISYTGTSGSSLTGVSGGAGTTYTNSYVANQFSAGGSHSYTGLSTGAYTSFAVQWNGGANDNGLLSASYTTSGGVSVSNGFAGQMDDLRVSMGQPAYFQSSTGSPYSRTPQEFYFTWLRGRGDYLTPGNGQLLADTETFTQGAGSWVKTGKMTFSRSNHKALVLPDGRVLVTGGYAYKDGQVNAPTSGQGVWTPTASAELYDPQSRTWMQAGTMSSPRASHMMVYIPETNCVMVFGGYQDASGTPAAPRYDLWNASTGLWSTGVSPIPTGNTANLTHFTAVPMSFGDSTLVWLAGAPGMVFIQGSDQISGGGLEGWQTVTNVIDIDTFQYQTPAYPQFSVNVGTKTVITPFKAPPAGKVPGPYIWDTTGSTPGITSVQATTATALYKGQQYETLTLSADVASSFPPEPGYLVLNFGSSEAVFPVPYLGLFSANALSLDYTFVMPYDVPAGATVTLIFAKGVYVPQTPEAVGSFYLTDSNSGRIDAEGVVENIAAGGLNVDISIVYPGDRGLGGEGLPATGQKFSDKVLVWGSNDLDVDELDAREGINLQVSGEEF